MKVKVRRTGAPCTTDPNPEKGVQIGSGDVVEVDKATADLWMKREPGGWELVTSRGSRSSRPQHGD